MRRPIHALATALYTFDAWTCGCAMWRTPARLAGLKILLNKHHCEEPFVTSPPPIPLLPPA
ncbi:hypothetical protein ACFQ1E_09865 [Sphingomonas canadensis]|uniref:Uncharacterized protein n=1 Tax=Sphingomonas canadensis TaxID=1219257 RepID=A0ABW3HBI0_9SPHN|nr:hypothetical protein [Sphingomonas canadensis]MCW3836575.1 hypothetical protein [Sphingomonas canadensis]